MIPARSRARIAIFAPDPATSFSTPVLGSRSSQGGREGAIHTADPTLCCRGTNAEGIGAAEPEIAVSGCTGKRTLRDALTELSEHRDRADEHFQPLHPCFSLLSLCKTRDSLYRAGMGIIS